ncbi:MAG: hydroxyacylglutathione hydrolase [Candidatus Dactylopiibacterium sp.]|nr:hydroxyacylglutathione hydrolase [Candidatus Dactylopiibacterium sp.]
MENEARIVPVSALRDNYIWTLSQAGRCIVVDPGEAAPVEDFLAREKLHLAAILLTHRHSDHQGGVAALCARHDVPVLGPSSAQMPCVSRTVSDRDSVRFEGFARAFEVIATPGHTEEHISWLHAGHLFCGDTLFAAGCGRLLGGTAAQLHASLQRLAALPDDTRICCAHEYTLSNLRFAQVVEPGNAAITARAARCARQRENHEPTLPCTLAEERETNPFLRCHEPAVQAAARQHDARTATDAPGVFAALRAWKDGF